MPKNPKRKHLKLCETQVKPDVIFETQEPDCDPHQLQILYVNANYEDDVTDRCHVVIFKELYSDGDRDIRAMPLEFFVNRFNQSIEEDDMTWFIVGDKTEPTEATPLDANDMSFEALFGGVK